MAKPNYNKKGGLTKLPKDARDFTLGAIEKLPDLKEIPYEDWIVSNPISLKDQQSSDFCTAFATTLASEIQENVELEPAYTFAKTKQIMGDAKPWGADLRSACKSHQKFGALPKNESPMSLATESIDNLRDWKNWHEKFDEQAKPYRKQSYFRVDTGVYDTFDNIRASLWKHRAEKRFVVTGAVWQSAWNSIIPKTKSSIVGGHAFTVIGQKMIAGEQGAEPYLVVQNSYGKSFGDNGLNYFPREVVNREFTFGSFMFLDRDPEEVKLIIKEKSMAEGTEKLWYESKEMLVSLLTVLNVVLGKLGIANIEMTPELYGLLMAVIAYIRFFHTSQPIASIGGFGKKK